MMIQITSVFRLEKREDQQLPDKSFRFPRDVVVLLVRYIVARLLPPYSLLKLQSVRPG